MREKQIKGDIYRRKLDAAERMVTNHGLIEFEPSISTQEFIQSIPDSGIIEIERGDTVFLSGWVEDQQGNPFDLTGCYLWHTAKRDIEDSDEDAVFQRTSDDGIAITDPVGGLYRIHIRPENTDHVTADETLIWDVQVQTPEDHVYTVTEGIYEVSRDITRSINPPA